MAAGSHPPHAPKVRIYTTPHCYWCGVAKRYFAEKHIDYVEIDVSHDKRGLREMVLMSGQRGVPVIAVGDHAMLGWDVREFEKLRKGGFKRR